MASWKEIWTLKYRGSSTQLNDVIFRGRIITKEEQQSMCLLLSRGDLKNSTHLLDNCIHTGKSPHEINYVTTGAFPCVKGSDLEKWWIEIGNKIKDDDTEWARQEVMRRNKEK